MRIAFLQSPSKLQVMSGDWERLLSEIESSSPDAVLFNEMPAGSWLPTAPLWSLDVATAGIREHDRFCESITVTATPTFYTRPEMGRSRLVNTAYVQEGGVRRRIHDKHYFPSEPGFFESAWFERGSGTFECIDVQGIRFAVLICSEMYFAEWARHYRRLGAHVILAPRASGGKLENWITAATYLAIVSGCYVISSNRIGPLCKDITANGFGFAVEPGGMLVSVTSCSKPVHSVEIDKGRVQAHQANYPCYIEE